MKRLRIAHIFTSEATQPGGVQTHVYYLTQELSARGHEVRVFSCGWPPACPFPDFAVIGSSFPVKLPNGNWGTISFVTKETQEFIKQANGGAFDICHIHEPHIGFMNWRLIAGIKIPIVTTFHAAWDKESILNVINPILPLFQPGFSANVVSAIFVSQLNRRLWQSLCGPQTLKQVIHHGIDHAIYYPLEKKPQTKAVRLLFVGRLVPKKGLLYLLRSLRRLKNALPFHLTVIGGGIELARAKRFVHAHDIKTVDFLGVVDEKTKARHYRESDVFCAPYVDESFGITLLEAMASGCTIVGFRNDAFREILASYPAKELLVKPQDEDALTKALKKAFMDKELRAHVGRWAEVEKQKYSWSEVARETEEVYRTILSRAAKI